MNVQIKTPLTYALVAATAVVLVAEPALAASGGEAHGFPWASWVTNLVNFAIFAGILYWFAGDAITDFFKSRRDTLVHDLDEARKLRQEASARLEEYTARLDALEDERKQLLEEYHQQGEREKKQIIEQAKRQIAKMRDDAEVTIDREVNKAIAELEHQVVDLAIQMTEDMACKRLGDREQKGLVDDYVDELSALNATESERAA